MFAVCQNSQQQQDLLLLLPPLFTGGTCTAEFEHEASRLQADSRFLDSPPQATAYWNSRQIEHTVLSPAQCAQKNFKDAQACGVGTIVRAKVPVNNKICRLYRDSEVRVELRFDSQGRLARMQTDMNPFKSWPVPFSSITLHWGK